ncbi:MAG: hypothetical protein EA404_06285 [Spirochaetaceae bacterium]|nr:MAG: hypothetical protein EA404_06285 [Spirochaetaceae bacterium]
MIKSDFQFELDPTAVLSYAGGAIEKRLRHPDYRWILDHAASNLQSLVEPLVVWNRFTIAGQLHDKVLLQNGGKVGSGPLAAVVAGAHELVVAVCTVGPALEAKAKALMKGGSMLEGIILDGVASWAVDDLRCMFYSWAMQTVKDNEGYRASSYLSPGESDWLIDDQRVIFELLAADIPSDRIALTESNVMVPFKSLSMAFGIGPDEMGSEGESNCDRCTIREVCRFRPLRAG